MKFVKCIIIRHVPCLSPELKSLLDQIYGVIKKEIKVNRTLDIGAQKLTF